MNKFDSRFCRRLWSLIKPYWRSDEKGKGFGLLALLLILGWAGIGLSVLASYIDRDLMTALSVRDASHFYHMLYFYGLWFVAVVPVYAFYGFLNGKLGITWRDWMTRWMLRGSLENRAYYRIGQAGQVDNPDQRVSEDVNNFVTGTINFALLFQSSLITALSFAAILWSISPRLAIMLLVYAAGATALTLFVGRELVGINFDQQRYEADFRFGLVHLRDNTESIALSSGEGHEMRELGRRLARVVRNFNQLILWQRNLSFLTTAYGNSVMLLPYMVLASAYFDRRLQLGQITQAVTAFASLQGALSLIVNQFQSLSSYGAVVNRLGSFREECAAARLPEEVTGAQIETVQSDDFALENLTVMTPDHRRVLVRDLSAELGAGGRLLIAGPSGIGKSSLLRALAGLWNRGEGRIVRPDLHEMMFLPQRPYMVLGTLRDQVCYPRMQGASDAQILEALALVNLEGLPERVGGLDVERNWAHILSPGEQQRVAFARLILNHPRYAFLDEATSALDPANEELLYGQLAKTPIVYASVSHRETLTQYHEQALTILGDGKWELAPLNPPPRPPLLSIAKNVQEPGFEFPALPLATDSESRPVPLASAA